MQEPLSTKVSATEKVLIKPVVEHFDENADLCAINWFNLKTPWMYQLYGLIASRYVRKVSARLFFKGTLVKKLEGPEDRQRENLLIVCYPGARAFLDLVDFKIFQMVSVLRLAAVKRFRFGFTGNLVKKTDCRGASDRKFSKQQIYLVHHFQAENSWLRDNRQLVFNSAARHNMGIYFCGLTTAHIAREKSGQQQSTEFFMDGILLFAAGSQTDIENFIKAEIYTTFKDKNSSNSLYLFSRTL
jgi:uncharacterized protein (DUF1330 family)